MAVAFCNLPRLVIAVLCTFLILGLILHSKPEAVPSLGQLQAIAQGCKASWNGTGTNTNTSTKEASARNHIESLFGPLRHSPTEKYIDSSGNKFELKSSQWGESLKKKVLIVDIDTREPNGDNEMLNTSDMSWERLQMSGGQLVSGAIMGHYLYAQIHGYDYKFIQARHMEGFYDTWIRPHILRRLIKSDEYQFILTLDADVTITHPEVPVEWLLNRWGATNNTSIMMPSDQEVLRSGENESADSKGKTVLNCGTILIQNLPHTKKMLDAWNECPSESSYKGCGHWKLNWSHEQRAFSEYIRYDFNPDGDNIIGVECDDAMGYPGMADEFLGMKMSDCNGHFFRHHTLNKGKAKESLQNSIMQLITQSVQGSFVDHKDVLRYKEPA